MWARRTRQIEATSVKHPIDYLINSRNHPILLIRLSQSPLARHPARRDSRSNRYFHSIKNHRSLIGNTESVGNAEASNWWGHSLQSSNPMWLSITSNSTPIQRVIRRKSKVQFVARVFRSVRPIFRINGKRRRELYLSLRVHLKDARIKNNSYEITYFKRHPRTVEIERAMTTWIFQINSIVFSLCEGFSCQLKSDFIFPPAHVLRHLTISSPCSPGII